MGEIVFPDTIPLFWILRQYALSKHACEAGFEMAIGSSLT
jgi:hypothetical protein